MRVGANDPTDIDDHLGAAPRRLPYEPPQSQARLRRRRIRTVNMLMRMTAQPTSSAPAVYRWRSNMTIPTTKKTPRMPQRNTRALARRDSPESSGKLGRGRELVGRIRVDHGATLPQKWIPKPPTTCGPPTAWQCCWIHRYLGSFDFGLASTMWNAPLATSDSNLAGEGAAPVTL